MAGKNLKNNHLGHRERLRQRFNKEGLDNFTPHQVLELILFYVIPRVDTNEIAHELINQFGSLSQVLDADIKDLVKINGVGKIVANFIKSLAPLSRYYNHDKVSKKNLKLNSTDKAFLYLKTLLDTKNSENFYVLCLDSQCGVIYPSLLNEGVVNETSVYPRKVVEIAIQHNASMIMIAHNHPSGNPKPSKADILITQKIISLMQLINIPLIDHIIIANSEYYSFRQSSDLFD